MGLFSMYAGFIYNDIFSKAMWLFSSAYYLPTEAIDSDHIVLPTNKTNSSHASPGCPSGCGFNGSPYPFGLDPVWALAANKLAFLNSFKMKMSVIVGVVHMLVAIFLNVFNHSFFKNKLKIYCETIPQFLFMASIFGYLCALIISKYGSQLNTNLSPLPPFLPCDGLGKGLGSLRPLPVCVYLTMLPQTHHSFSFIICTRWLNSYPPFHGGGQTDPSLLVVLISMFLSPNDISYGSRTYMYRGQSVIQKILVATAVLCVPWMLLSHILVQKFRQKLTSSRAYNQLENISNYELGVFLNCENEAEGNSEIGLFVQEPVNAADESHCGPPEGRFGEILVNRAIHTIEFCLGAVSNTASYLRLWALSLAHAQLSEVLWTMVLRPAFTKSFIVLYIAFFIWATLSVFVLVIMEGLSAFLHALRLHWCATSKYR
ncbi:V-type proton ATPase 116 kDa subunit a 2-like [Zophobas morio]|uniref:V-type proton ATPase 116 kDa subunit a 2-like n=1 Tax=Zophobas morio TaxID=2755281 RepID=UPI00308337AD